MCSRSCRIGRGQVPADSAAAGAELWAEDGAVAGASSAHAAGMENVNKPKTHSKQFSHQCESLLF